jgi:hypothetical protein
MRTDLPFIDAITISCRFILLLTVTFLIACKSLAQPPLNSNGEAPLPKFDAIAYEHACKQAAQLKSDLRLITAKVDDSVIQRLAKEIEAGPAIFSQMTIFGTWRLFSFKRDVPKRRTR